MLSQEHFDIILAILIVKRHKQKRTPDDACNENDLRDVLDAMGEAGFVLVPEGSIEAVRKLIEKVNGRKYK
jgi:hypothetical protein